MISFRSRRQVSRMTLRILLSPGTESRASRTPRISASTNFHSPERAIPAFMTMSISWAPPRADSTASLAFSFGVVCPRGKPTTVHTLTSLPLRRRAATGT